MERMDGMEVPPVGRHGPVTTPGADPHAIERVAETLVKAHSPLIITGQSGRNPSTVGAIVELAEAIGAPVVSDPTFVNFPTDHALYAGSDAEGYLEEADAILIID